VQSRYWQIVQTMLFSTSVVLPLTGGVSFLLLSWATESNGCAFLGFLGLLSGFGSFVTNLCFNWSKHEQMLVAQAEQEKAEADNLRRKAILAGRRERERKLDLLDEKLLRDRDPRDQTLLRTLRKLYSQFERDLDDRKFGDVVTAEIVQQVDKLFQECVTSLEQSFRHWEMSRSLDGETRDNILSERTRILDDVDKSVQMMDKSMTDIRTMSLQTREQRSMDSLREELDRSLEVARVTEEQMRIFNERVRLKS